MKAASVLILALSHQGYWFGGQAGTVRVQWAAQTQLPEAVLVWELMSGAARFADGRVALPSDERTAEVTLTTPAVRVRTVLHWVYRVQARNTGRTLTQGRATIHVFPDDRLAGLAERLVDTKLAVWDAADGLPALLSRAGIRFIRVDHAAMLQVGSADVILVGPDRIGASPFSQSALLGQARTGASVMCFAQTKTRRLGGYVLADRSVPAKLAWRVEHPLLAHFRAEDMQSWLTGARSDVRAVRLPADEPALEVAYWPRETPGEEPVPIDALVAVKTIGAGRLVLWQVPLGAWERDPRSQQLVANALRYLLTRPAPTVPPSRRHTTTQPQPPPVPTITIPSGVKP